MNKIIIANWKMNLTPREEFDLAGQFKKQLKISDNKEVVICPSFVGLYKVAEALDGSKIALGAQDVFYKERGAYTGEISVRALKEVGCQYVIVGHSERRKNQKEDYKVIAQKTEAVVEAGLIPIVCVGESLEERKDNRTDAIIERQLGQVIDDLDLVKEEQLIVAYEPIWAIGTGQIATRDKVEHVLGLIHQKVLDSFPQDVAKNNVRVIYGGSVTGQEAGQFSAGEVGDGFLVGGASLRTDDFSDIIKNT